MLGLLASIITFAGFAIWNGATLARSIKTIRTQAAARVHLIAQRNLP